MFVYRFFSTRMSHSQKEVKCSAECIISGVLLRFPRRARARVCVCFGVVELSGNSVLFDDYRCTCAVVLTCLKML